MMSNVAIVRWNGRELKVWIETVTPRRAEEVLATDKDRNRKLRQARVSRYAADMRKGKWRLTCEPIRLDEKGALLNGQHRLKAIVNSGCSVPLMFVSGVSSTTLLVQDTGLPKSDADWSLISVKAIRVTKVMIRLFCGAAGNGSSADEQLEVYHLLGPEHVEWAISSALTKGITNKAPVQAALSLLHKINPERATVFLDRLKEHAFPAKSPESALDSILSSVGSAQSQRKEAENAFRAIVAAARDPEKPCVVLKGLGDAERAWLIKAASLDKLTNLRRPLANGANGGLSKVPVFGAEAGVY